MLTTAKFLLIGTVASVLSTVIGDTATQVATLAAGVAGGTYLLHKLAHVLKLAAEFLRRWIATVQIIQAVPAVVAQLTEQLSALDGRLDALERTADQIREPVTAVARELDIDHRAPAGAPAPHH